MARKARVEFAGALYHLLDRGDRREEIFRDDHDRNRFLDTLGQVCARTGWRVHAYVAQRLHLDHESAVSRCLHRAQGDEVLDAVLAKRLD